ncbi:Serine/threonine protein kinase OSK3 [Balamuthia mandrillaris]
MIENVKKEIAILKRIKHKHVIELKDVLVSQTKIYLVMELSTGGELYYILATKGKFNEKTARKYFQQLISGVDYFHKQGICHRDLKPENLLLSEEGTLKISDFGLSTLYKDDNKGSRLLFTACGTPNYAAPEVLEGKGYDGKIADIWSCGCILFTFLAGYLPFNESSTEELYSKIRTADFKTPSWVSLGARDILRRILCPNPARRITIQELRQHEWFLIDNECTFEEEPSVDLSAVNPDEEITQINELKNSGDGDAEFSSDVETTSPRELLGTLHKYYGLLKDITEGFTSQLRRSTGSVTTRLRETHQTQFVSQHPPTVILERLIAVLKGYPEVGYKVDQESFKVRVTGRADKEAGLLSFRIQIFELEPNGMYLVDFVKGRGDALAFHKFYQHIWEQVKDLCSNSADAVEAARKRSNPKPLSSSEIESLNRRFPSSAASSLSSSPSSHASSPLLSREDHAGNTYAYGEEDVEQKEEEEGWGGAA